MLFQAHMIMVLSELCYTTFLEVFRNKSSCPAGGEAPLSPKTLSSKDSLDTTQAQQCELNCYILTRFCHCLLINYDITSR